MGLFDRGIELKSPTQIDAMRVAGLVVADTLALLREEVRAGLTTADLNAIAEEAIRARGGVPSFLGYHGFPGSICTSVNAEVVHGIPGPRVLVEGDVVSVDCGAIVDGWHGDAAITVAIGRRGGGIADDVARLLSATEEAMWVGVAAAAAGGRVVDISRAIETSVRASGDYGIVEDYTGHGIGTAMHQVPDVPNVVVRGRSPRLVTGMALAVEPMLTLGTHENVVLDDEWTVVTADGSLAAHSEHTIALTETGTWVLTALDGGKAELDARGAPYGGH